MIRVQFVRYVVIGLGLNGALYAAYLLLSSLVTSSRGAMTITFAVGTLLCFIANRNLTFGHRGDQWRALVRFAACYASLYIINLAALWIIAERIGVPHQIVQAGVILVLPFISFVIQKYWVFPAVAVAGAAPFAAGAGR